MATTCPKCEKGTLKKGEKMVYCSEYKPVKNEDGSWKNEGSCDFKIMFANKVFGAIDAGKIKQLVQGDTLTNKKGDTMVLDLKNDYFTKITFPEKIDDEDL
jgi:hypothetical protein